MKKVVRWSAVVLSLPMILAGGILLTAVLAFFPARKPPTYAEWRAWM